MCVSLLLYSSNCLSVSEDFSFRVGHFWKLIPLTFLQDGLTDWDETLQIVLESCKLVHDMLKRQNILHSGALAIQTPNVLDIRAHNAVSFPYIFNNESNNDPSLIRL